MMHLRQTTSPAVCPPTQRRRSCPTPRGNGAGRGRPPPSARSSASWDACPSRPWCTSRTPPRPSTRRVAPSAAATRRSGGGATSGAAWDSWNGGGRPRGRSAGGRTPRRSARPFGRARRRGTRPREVSVAGNNAGRSRPVNMLECSGYPWQKSHDLVYTASKPFNNPWSAHLPPGTSASHTGSRCAPSHTTALMHAGSPPIPQQHECYYNSSLKFNKHNERTIFIFSQIVLLSVGLQI